MEVCALTIRRAVVKVRRSRAEVAELVDALASGASGGIPVEVQVLSSAPSVARISRASIQTFLGEPLPRTLHQNPFDSTRRRDGAK